MTDTTAMIRRSVPPPTVLPSITTLDAVNGQTINTSYMHVLHMVPAYPGNFVHLLQSLRYTHKKSFQVY